MEPKQKILIVDDSEINRAMLKEILGEGYESCVLCHEIGFAVKSYDSGKLAGAL